MKKQVIALLVVGLLVQIEAPVQAFASASTETKIEKSINIFKKKRRGYRPKKGGLFGTGLFRKKSPCGCPNN